ncbi:hypothetical protein ASF61_15885 [Duganella sp. Leaf126]|nr:hypothetical protein ASF61_15885 [Duganella sp. Leaf126]
MIQSINNVHRYFLKQPLLSPDETKSVIDRLVLDRDRLAVMKPGTYLAARIPNEDVKARTRMEFEKILKRLHSAVSNHWPNASGKAAKTDPSIVKKIFISTFGFSRGATQARAFTNWMMALCSLDARLSKRGAAMTLGGFEVEFSFLGLFDAAASIGLGNTLGNTLYGKLFDGHGAWADAESSLRIPPGLRCVHLVAAHEIRRSFPLDSISVKQSLPDNTDEIVVPGVHSDLGCGYMPREQGRGIDADGGDMLSRIPLIYMYREARLAGVPLKLERANDSAKLRFILLPETLKAFNAYIATCKVKSGTLTAIMRDQNKKRMLWNKARRASGKTPIEATASFKRASTFDQNDLHSSNLEFEQEIKSFERWLADKGKGFTPRLQAPGFDNDYEDEWEEIASWWHNEPTPGPEVLEFFDNYVHDSRAWFKLIPGNPDNETELIVKLKQWSQRRQRTQAYNAKQDKEYVERRKIRKLTSDDGLANNELPPAPMLDGLTDNERRASEEFERTGKIPRMLTTGREPFDSLWMPARAGYLRYRKIYSGFDSVLISSVNRQTQDESAA